MSLTPPIPCSEYERIWSLSCFNVNSSIFRDLAKLAARTLISLFNLVDTYIKCHCFFRAGYYGRERLWFGLQLVKHLIKVWKGKLNINCVLG